MILNENPKPLDLPGGGGSGSAPIASINFYSDPGFTVLIADFDYRDTVYVKIVANDFTAVTYTLTVNNQSNTEIEIQKNGTGEFTYQSLFAGAITFRGEAENIGLETIGESKVINVDDLSDNTVAAEFIYQHNAETGLTMAATQRSAITTLVKNLDGDGTFNSSQFLPRLIAQGSKLYPYCPVDNSTANANAYKMCLIDPSANLTFINFVSGDFTPNGVTGGATKQAATGITAQRYLAQKTGFHAYSRSNTTPTGTQVLGNSSGGNLEFWLRDSGQCYTKINSVTYTNAAVADSLGLFSSSIKIGTSTQIYKRGVLVTTGGPVLTPPTANEIYLHSGGSTNYETRQIAGYCLGFTPETANEWADWEELWTRYQTNVITGGRQV